MAYSLSLTVLITIWIALFLKFNMRKISKVVSYSIYENCESGHKIYIFMGRRGKETEFLYYLSMQDDQQGFEAEVKLVRYFYL